MKRLVLFLCTLFLTAACAQNKSAADTTLDFQESLNKDFKNPETSPLPKDAIKNFKSLDFFPFSELYVVSAKLTKTPDSKPFEMPTTTQRKPMYKKYGELHFKLNGSNYVLSVFQNLELIQKSEFKNSLFLPFTDLTSGVSSYGGGRYMDIEIPEGDTLILNFNLSYNPYCVYNPKYSCPIPPEENFINTEIKAGIKEGF
ncbi:DUF1684 domain-containing protein [Flavobacterium sp. NKUCC04_CG]|uniref:DUF1684 domain-containing protein n=1 Tax=Flavobacterium sp. NKUCC04_CG TaxID=2842121 RepID=UPI001C5B361C|nr:DUF1684 domain-containing protein [Flavobacterium sp. NKUCC04_CG]MBW3520123.1 DUF1684 domain-containing protein [Flavobacterium sp. NKUCC04_CG]